MLTQAAMRLGKLAPRPQPSKLKLSAYVLPSLPTPPAVLTPAAKIHRWGMMLNDQLGDCAIAGPGHAELLWTTLNGHPFTPTDNQILAAYEAIGHYNPKDPSTDGGCVLADVLDAWKATGIAGRKISAYAPVHRHDHNNVKLGVLLFGCLDIGLALPVSAQDQFIWDVPKGGLHGDAAPGGWGGHCVIIVGYNATGPICVTWGQAKQMTWAFWDAYCDEAYVALSPDWLGGAGKCPSGFDLKSLQQDMAAFS